MEHQNQIDAQAFQFWVVSTPYAVPPMTSLPYPQNMVVPFQNEILATSEHGTPKSQIHKQNSYGGLSFGDTKANSKSIKQEPKDPDEYRSRVFHEHFTNQFVKQDIRPTAPLLVVQRPPEVRQESQNASQISMLNLSHRKTCSTCGKLFKSRQQLNQHMLVHTDVRRYTCTYCDRAFKQASHLQQHHRIHTGEKPYRCPLAGCSRAFPQLSNLNHHLRNHDKPDPPTENTCIFCKRVYASDTVLQNHVQKIHMNQPQSVKTGAATQDIDNLKKGELTAPPMSAEPGVPLTRTNTSPTSTTGVQLAKMNTALPTSALSKALERINSSSTLMQSSSSINMDIVHKRNPEINTLAKYIPNTTSPSISTKLSTTASELAHYSSQQQKPVFGESPNGRNPTVDSGCLVHHKPIQPRAIFSTIPLAKIKYSMATRADRVSQEMDRALYQQTTGIRLPLKLSGVVDGLAHTPPPNRNAGNLVSSFGHSFQNETLPTYKEYQRSRDTIYSYSNRQSNEETDMYHSNPDACYNGNSDVYSENQTIKSTATMPKAATEKDTSINIQSEKSEIKKLDSNTKRTTNPFDKMTSKVSNAMENGRGDDARLAIDNGSESGFGASYYGRLHTQVDDYRNGPNVDDNANKHFNEIKCGDSLNILVNGDKEMFKESEMVAFSSELNRYYGKPFNGTSPKSLTSNDAIETVPLINSNSRKRKAFHPQRVVHNVTADRIQDT